MKVQYSTAVIAAAAYFSAKVMADSETFGLVVVESKSVLEHAGVYVDSYTGFVYVSEDNSDSEYLTSLAITEDGKLQLSDETYAVTLENGQLQETHIWQLASSGFAIKDGFLIHEDEDKFYAAQSQDYEGIYNLHVKEPKYGKQEEEEEDDDDDDDDGVTVLQIRLGAVNSSGDNINDFEPVRHGGDDEDEKKILSDTNSVFAELMAKLPNNTANGTAGNANNNNTVSSTSGSSKVGIKFKWLAITTAILAAAIAYAA